jgi:hypothetical protein
MHIDTDSAGRELAQTIDREALFEEGHAENGLDTLLPEILHSFKIQFDENQQHIQHQIIDGAFSRLCEEKRPEAPSLTQDELVTEARELANDVLYAYANELAPNGANVHFSELPAASSEFFAFREAIVDGFYRDTVEEMLEVYAEE